MEEVDIYTTPALAPPPGVVPNLANAYTLQPYLIATASVHAEFATVILVGCFPVIPRLLRWLFGRDPNKSYGYHTQDYRRRGRDSPNASHNKRDRNVSKTASSIWSDRINNSQSTESYIPLENHHLIIHDGAENFRREAHIEALPKAYQQQQRANGRDLSDAQFGKNGHTNKPAPITIQKTVDMSTTFS
ncbi:MAG: hypothetical protein Q9160_002605 [Pyrenula sp. 1 TL-2023]